MSDVHALVTKKLHADASRAAAASRLQVSIFQAELTELDERRMEAERDLANATNQRDEWHEENMALEMKLAELEEALDNARNQAAYAEVRDVGVTSNGSRQHCLENSSDAESLASSHAQPDQSLPSEAKFNGDAAAQYDAKPARTEVDVQLRALSSELSSCEVVELQIRQRLIEQRRDPRLKLQSHIEQLQQEIAELRVRDETRARSGEELRREVQAKRRRIAAAEANAVREQNASASLRADVVKLITDVKQLQMMKILLSAELSRCEEAEEKAAHLQAEASAAAEFAVHVCTHLAVVKGELGNCECEIPRGAAEVSEQRSQARQVVRDATEDAAATAAAHESCLVGALRDADSDAELANLRFTSAESRTLAAEAERLSDERASEARERTFMPAGSLFCLVEHLSRLQASFVAAFTQAYGWLWLAFWLPSTICFRAHMRADA
uniref:Uncharacterized protein n=1 Tax=Chrysotila carterae TaxID=13221 RepID=A0A7S4F0S7_CHRCT